MNDRPGPRWKFEVGVERATGQPNPGQRRQQNKHRHRDQDCQSAKEPATMLCLIPQQQCSAHVVQVQTFWTGCPDETECAYQCGRIVVG